MPSNPQSRPARFGQAPSEWPGQRLGFPQQGIGSVARGGRRLIGLFIDFTLCYIVYFAFFFGNQWASGIIFALSQIVLLALIGSGFGHLVLGMQLIKLDGSHVGLWRPILRTVLLALLLPAVVWDSDQRGLHDVFSGTVLVMKR